MTDYDAIQALNFSALKNMDRGPLHYAWRLQHPKQPTAAMRKGTAVHCVVLEPEQFPERYAIIDLNRNSKAYKEQAALEAEAGREILKTSELDEIKQIADGVAANPTAAELLTQSTTEAALTWTMHGRQCKGRIDAYKDGVLVDLKTAADPQPWAFNAQIAKMNYHAQLAWYAAGLAEVQGQFPEVFIIAVGNKEPYECIVHSVPVSVLAAGEEKYLRWLEELDRCEGDGRFPSRYEGVNEVQLPAWAANEVEVDFSGLEDE